VAQLVVATARRQQLRRALKLEYFSLVWNVIEAVVGLAAGLAAGSVALIGFALDSVVESSSAAVLTWRIKSEESGRRSNEDAERRAVRLVAVAFFALAVYVAGHSLYDLILQKRPEGSPVGIGLALVSLVVMPLLARAKRRAARAINSRSLQADSKQTSICTWLSAVLLGGLLANSVWGWWWADPLAGLVIVAVAAREGWELWTTEDFCCL
jgi:divalent metal cation (Fe/Co/Zn/Cd) transporter